MPDFGWDNELPLELGGGTSRIEDIYNGLRSAVGDGGAAAEGTLEDLWRECKAQAIAGALDAVERAALQAFANLATDHIPVYERALGVIPAADATEQDRREVITVEWTRKIDARMSAIENSLQAISSQFVLEELDYDLVAVAMFGRMFPPAGLEALYGVPQYPNFSSDFVLRVIYNLAVGELACPAPTRDSAKRLLNSVLPGWMDWAIYTKSAVAPAGLFCDGGVDGTSVLDFTPLAI